MVSTAEEERSVADGRRKTLAYSSACDAAAHSDQESLLLTRNSLDKIMLAIRNREAEAPPGKVDMTLFRDLLDCTETVFSSSQSLLTAYGSGSSFNSRQLAMMQQSLLDVYTCDVKKHQVVRALHKASLALLSEASNDQRDEHQLTSLLALFQSPLMMIESKAKELAPKLGSIFGRSSTIRRKLLEAWIQYPQEVFSQIVSAMQAYASSELLRERSLTPSVMSIIRVMSKLHAANCQRSDPLPVEDFYNSVVSEKLDVMDHYLAWRQSQDPPKREGTQPPFSFCEFPFLLSASAKAKLLQAEVHLLKDQAIALSQAQIRMYGKEQASPSILPAKAKKDTTSTSASQGSFSFASRLLSFFQTKIEPKPDPDSLPSPSQCSVAPTHAEACVVRVRRLCLVQDSLEEISRQSVNDLRKPLRVVFIGEEGIDAGGLKKEWFQLLMEKLLEPGFGLVTHNEETNQLRLATRAPESHFFLLGVIVGLAVYNSVLLNFPLATSLSKKLLGRESLTLLDLEQTYPRLGQSMRQILLFEEGPEGSVEETFGLTFSLDILKPTGLQTIELIPGGASTPVTVHNRAEFVQRVVAHHLDDSIRAQFGSFSSGFKTIVSGPVIKLLEPTELERLICGSPAGIDIDELRGITNYEGGYDAESPAVRWFWEAVREMNKEDQKKLLLFVTGTDRTPIGGISRLKFVLQRNTAEDTRIPTSHTCFSTLLLPEYKSSEILKERLQVALANAQGFGLK